MSWTFWKHQTNYKMIRLSSDSTPDSPQQSRARKLCIFVLPSFVIILLIISSFLVTHKINLIPQGIPKTLIAIRHCGNSPSEARARGCLFESSNLAWLPAECYDKELSDEWDAKRWVYAYGSDKHNITQEEVSKGDLDHVWVTWSQHISHCALMALKFQRAVQFNWPMDDWTTSYAHSLHCTKSYTEWEYMKTPDKLNSKIFIKFPVCDYSWQDMIS